MRAESYFIEECCSLSAELRARVPLLEFVRAACEPGLLRYVALVVCVCMFCVRVCVCMLTVAVCVRVIE